MVQGLAALATAVGIGAAVATLTRGERLRRRLKMHADILSVLPAGDDADRLNEIVGRDVKDLHALVFPDPARRSRQLHEVHDWWILPVFFAGATGMVASLVGHEPRGLFALLLGIVGGVGLVGLFISSARWRRARMVRRRVANREASSESTQ